MGSPEEELKRSDEEIPHQVTLTKGFWMSVHPVTQAHWRAVRGDNPSNYPGDDRPVERTQWYECQEFCQKLGRTDGRPYRLPTEAEWEYACRAGTTTPFAFGETLSAGQASCNSKRLSGKGKKRVFSGKTTPVGSFPANAWGLHDMHGNVWEWCADWYGPYPNESLTDPQGARKGEKRVIRGGSYGNLPEHCRSAYRGDYAPGLREGYRGLRAAF
jgi:formylglycine-generating enzyme required for sulfatase activity